MHPEAAPAVFIDPKQTMHMAKCYLAPSSVLFQGRQKKRKKKKKRQLSDEGRNQHHNAKGLMQPFYLKSRIRQRGDTLGVGSGSPTTGLVPERVYFLTYRCKKSRFFSYLAFWPFVRQGEDIQTLPDPPGVR